MPRRKIAKSFANVTGEVVSRRLGRMVQAESPLERDLIWILEFHPAVSDFEEQPITIEWADAGGNTHRYTPDFLIRFGGANFIRRCGTLKPWLVEVKPHARLVAEWHELRPKYRAATAEAARQGWTFHLLTDREIRTPYLQNIAFLRSAKNQTLEPGVCKPILDTLRAHPSCTLADLVNSLAFDEPSRGRLLPCIWKLILNGSVGVDLAVPVSMGSRLWLRTSS